MTTIKAIVRNGQIKTDRPLDLPDGTELTISIPDADSTPDDSPEAVEAWIRWYDQLEPLSFTPEERAAWETARHQEKQFELAQWEKRSALIEEQFP